MAKAFPLDQIDATILVTGAAGFIGSSFARLVHARFPTLRIVVLDKLTYAGNLDNLAPIADSPRYAFLKGDVAVEDDVEAAFGLAKAPVAAVVHFAAESHVDRSIDDPSTFLVTNVLGTEIMARVARRRGVQRFVHVSTDEVYGTLSPDNPAFSESTPIAPNSPYAASKGGSDLIVRAYFETYGFPAIITRCSNNYGPYQYPEKLIPVVIERALADQPIPVYGRGVNVRDWIYVDDHSLGVIHALERGAPGQVYNLGGQTEKTNLDVVRTILRHLGKPESLIEFVQDRPGHDLRYAMNVERARRELDWSPKRDFQTGIAETIDWYVANRDWIERLRSR